MSDDLQQRLRAIQDGFLSSREVIKSQDFLIDQLRTQLATVIAERDRLRERVEKLEKVREAAEFLAPEIAQWASGEEETIHYSDIAQFTSVIDDLVQSLKACEEKEPTP